MEAKKIAGMAEAHYVHIAAHLYCGPIEAVANIQIGTCSPNFLIQESIETFGGFHAELLKEPITVGCQRNWTLLRPRKPRRLGVVEAPSEG